MKLSEDLSDIYFFRSPQLYFKMVEVAIMLNSLYLSLWACNFITIVNEYFSRSPFFHIVMLVPLLIVLPSLGEIVKVSSLLAAISDLDLDVIGSVLEISEEKTQLVNEVREKILTRIHGKGDEDKMLVLKELFEEIDSNGNGQISKYELREMLRALALHYSDYKFKRLYAAMDKDRSGEMDMDEFLDLVFPALAQKREMRRRALLLHQHSNAYTDSQEVNLGPHLQGFKSTIDRLDSEINQSAKQDAALRDRTNSGESMLSNDGIDSSKGDSERLVRHDEVGDSGSNREKIYTKTSVSDIDEQTVETPISPMLLGSSFRKTPLHEKENIYTTDEFKEETKEDVINVLSDDGCCVTPPLRQNKQRHSCQESGQQQLSTSTNMDIASPAEKITEIEQFTVQDNTIQMDTDFLDYFNTVYGDVYTKHKESDDDASYISALGESVCKMEDMDMGGHDGASVFSADDHHHDQQSMAGGSYNSAYDSDDNSLMTATIRVNQEHIPKRSQTERNPDLYKPQSIELKTLIKRDKFPKIHQTDRKEEQTFCILNPRAATALHHIASSQQQGDFE